MRRFHLRIQAHSLFLVVTHFSFRRSWRIEDSEFNTSSTHTHTLILKVPKKSHSLGMHSLKHLVMEAEETWEPLIQLNFIPFMPLETVRMQGNVSRTQVGTILATLRVYTSCIIATEIGRLAVMDWKISLHA